MDWYKELLMREQKVLIQGFSERHSPNLIIKQTTSEIIPGQINERRKRLWES